MYRRINVTLPEKTLRLLDRSVPRGGRSRLIDAALREHLGKTNKKKLRQLLKEGAIQRSQRDLELAAEWLPIEEEAWRRIRD
ncbi:hypothetical protein HY256_12020 [Candidatus Sumerlaeota bacterium]|nr:hypothetical protein [Candidatus Sumerlaeota bacterium]